MAVDLADGLRLEGMLGIAACGCVHGMHAQVVQEGLPYHELSLCLEPEYNSFAAALFGRSLTDVRWDTWPSRTQGCLRNALMVGMYYVVLYHDDRVPKGLVRDALSTFEEWLAPVTIARATEALESPTP